MRRLQLHWLRVQWRLLVLAVPFCGVLTAVVFWLVPKPVAPYVVGAIVASVGWLIYVVMLETGGLAALQSGILAEQWTAGELRKFHRRGWWTINHVMLMSGDSDHALLGPGGFFSVETKFRSDWAKARPYLDGIARKASETARSVRFRIDVKGRAVDAVVVLWGPDVEENFTESFELNGVTFCPGALLYDFVDALPPIVEPAEVHGAFLRLSGYVRKRDIGEIAKSGELPRTLNRSFNDVIAIGGTAMVLVLAIFAPASRPPEGLWSTAAAVATIVIAVLARRWRPGNVRLRLLTTAAIATASGLGVLMAIATVVLALQ